MKKIGRLRKSRDRWKAKAGNRATDIREMRKKIKRQEKRIQTQKEALEETTSCSKSENTYLDASVNRRNLDNVVSLKQAAFIRAFCVLLVISGIVPFRAVPRILQLFDMLRVASFQWIPHFTSIINWTLRAGMANLKNITTNSSPWIAIIDCSIDIGTRKALVVLRVSLSALQDRGGAIGLKDSECIGMEVANSWNGSSIETALSNIFKKAGKPIAVLKDKGSDIKKGVVLWSQNQDGKKVWVIDDIGHETANALKAEYEKSSFFKKFIEITRKGAARIRQTSLAFLLPPKIGSKARFQNITKTAKWAGKLINFIGRKGRAKKNSDVSRLRAAFSGLSLLTPFIKRFVFICSVVLEFQKLLKNKGLNQMTYKEGMKMLETIPKRSKVRKRLEKWLDKTLYVQCRLGIGQTPLLVSSDVIESLFGKFKVIIQRNPMAELNRLIYTIPLLCGETTIANIDDALREISHVDLVETIEDDLPETLRSTRQQILNGNKGVPKTGKLRRADSG